MFQESAVVDAGERVGQGLVFEVADAFHVEGSLQREIGRKPDEAGTEKENAGYDQIGDGGMPVPGNRDVTQVADHEKHDQTGHRAPAFTGATRRQLPRNLPDDRQRSDQDQAADKHEAVGDDR